MIFAFLPNLLRALLPTSANISWVPFWTSGMAGGLPALYGGFPFDFASDPWVTYSFVFASHSRATGLFFLRFRFLTGRGPGVR